MIGSSCCYMYVTGKTPEPSLHNYTIIVKAYVRYCSNITSHTLKIFVEPRARVKQTYFSTSTAHRSGSRSRNIKLRQSIQSSRQVLSSLKIYLLQSSISCPYSMLDTTYERKTIVITLRKFDIFNL